MIQAKQADDFSRAGDFLEQRITTSHKARLSSVKTLADEAGVSYFIMRKSAMRLQQRGVLELRQGGGIILREQSDDEKKAHVYLDSLIARLQSSVHNRLPRIKDMALQAGVPQHAMATAVHLRVKSGSLHSSNRSGICLARKILRISKAKKNAEEGISKWLRVRRIIDKDILDGKFLPGARLPNVKELEKRYGACHQTIGKALRDLASHGLLRPEGAQFRIPLRERSDGGGVVILVARGTPGNELYVLANRTYAHLRSLEYCCMRRGVELLIVVANDRGLQLRVPCSHYRTFSEILKRKSVLGFMFWTMGMKGFDVPAILAQITSYDRPLSVLDEGDDFAPQLFNLSVPTRLFSVGGNRKPGRVVARYLLANGHRRIAYLSPFHETLYSQNRLEGMIMESEMAGFPDTVTPHTVSSIAPSEAAKPSERTVRKEVIKSMEAAGLIHEAAGHAVDPSIVSSIEWDILAELQRKQALRDRLYPLLDKMMSGACPSAIACVNDEVALECLIYMRTKGTKVPEDVSVVGFDNTLPAIAENISSYDFNSDAAMNALLNFIVNPSQRIANPGMPVEIDGFVMERESSGAVG